ncbi:MAG: acetylornithine deacetylase [bacterium]|nr:acetylornithine deacetylase [bacterium]
MASLLSDADLLRRLVSFDTTSHNSNLPMSDFLCDYLDRPGVAIERNPSPDGDKTNLVVTVGGRGDSEEDEERPGLVLSGHMDVVPAGEPEWRSDPFELIETETGYVGRGACDMKGFVALAVNAAARAETERLSHPLVLLLTYDEEIGTLGARHFVDTWPAERSLPRRAIVGEPTSLRAVRMHKGHASARLTFHGVGAHTGYPHLGKSAIEPAGRAVVALAELRRQLEAEHCPHGEHFGEVPFVALSASRIRGGTAVNVVPDRCVIDVGFRVLPGMEAAPIAERIQLAVTEAAGESFEMSRVEQSPPLLLDDGNDLYRAVCELIGQDRTVSVSYATDGGWFATAGLDCLIWGPGTIDVAHKPNEWMPKDELSLASQLLEVVVERFCANDR